MSAAPSTSNDQTAPVFPADAQPPANPTFGILPLEKLRELDGIELFRGIIAGTIPGAPIAEGMNMWIHEAEIGRVVFAARPQRRHYNPIGSVHGGFTGTMMDSAMSCAIQSTLKKGMGYTTLEYRVHLVRGLSDKIGPVFCEGKIVNVGKQVGTSEGRIYDTAGKLYAHGTTTCLIFPI
jgi:uncharacterized protein (TIGR00369 family)